MTLTSCEATLFAALTFQPVRELYGIQHAMRAERSMVWPWTNTPPVDSSSSRK